MVDSDYENEGHLAIEMGKMMPRRPRNKEEYIFKIPSALRGVGDAFNPNVVSIGPLHNGKPELHSMEKYKRRYLSNCLSYNPNITPEDIKITLRGLEETVLGAYNQEHFPHTFSSEEFVDMMLLDGCFIIHLFILRWNRDVAKKYEPAMFAPEFFSKIVQRDLRLVENQLPFFLLEHLFGLIFTREQRDGESFFNLAIHNFGRYAKLGGNILENSEVPPECMHFGHLILQCFCPSIDYGKPSVEDFGALPNASELHKLGVEFKKSKNDNLLDITFSKGVLEIPEIRMTQGVGDTFRNMIAMEQFRLGSKKYITDYAVLLNYLVHTKEDVSLLRSRQVIDGSYLGDDQNIIDLFRSMTGGVIRISNKHSHYYGMIQKIHLYKNQRCNQVKANIKKDWNLNPVTWLSLFAGLIALVLTLIATVFTVLAVVK